LQKEAITVGPLTKEGENENSQQEQPCNPNKNEGDRLPHISVTQQRLQHNRPDGHKREGKKERRKEGFSFFLSFFLSFLNNVEQKVISQTPAGTKSLPSSLVDAPASKDALIPHDEVGDQGVHGIGEGGGAVLFKDEVSKPGEEVTSNGTPQEQLGLSFDHGVCEDGNDQGGSNNVETTANWVEVLPEVKRVELPESFESTLGDHKVVHGFYNFAHFNCCT
jgi:hypothetical protein